MDTQCPPALVSSCTLQDPPGTYLALLAHHLGSSNLLRDACVCVVIRAGVSHAKICQMNQASCWSGLNTSGCSSTQPLAFKPPLKNRHLHCPKSQSRTAQKHTPAPPPPPRGDSPSFCCMPELQKARMPLDCFAGIQECISHNVQHACGLSHQAPSDRLAWAG